MINRIEVESRIEVELSRHLKPVAAPDELWVRIQTGPGVEPHKPRGLLWSAAAVAAATCALCYFTAGSDRTSSFTKAAWQELASGSEKVDFRSSEPLEIRAWIKAHAGLDVPLASAHSVQFIGVTLLQNSPCMVCVSYRVGNAKGKLLVARGGFSGPEHPSIRQTSFKGATIVSWAAAGQAYAMATSMEGLHAGCALCHVESKNVHPA